MVADENMTYTRGHMLLIIIRVFGRRFLGHHSSRTELSGLAQRDLSDAWPWSGQSLL